MTAPLARARPRFCPGVPGTAEPLGRGKRTLDVTVAGLLLLACAPTLAAVAALVRLTSPGPALFRQVRVGHGGRLFVVWKFRTMRADADDRIHREYVTSLLTAEAPPDGGRPGLYKLADDPRVTPLGAWLRRTSLDELPQLYNVLRGDMSLVGPRPALPWEVEHYDPEHLERFRVPPGITGLWQVEGRSTLGMREALRLDVEYARRRTLALDVALLVRTVGAVLRSSGAR